MSNLWWEKEAFLLSPSGEQDYWQSPTILEVSVLELKEEQLATLPQTVVSL